jgi:hypothetical protein
MLIYKKKFEDKKVIATSLDFLFEIQMNYFWWIPTSNLLINTFLRSIMVIAIMIIGFQSSWYSAYWAAIIHDAISLVLIKDLIY